MTARTDPSPEGAAPADASAFRRLQHENQAQIASKLLHDLRNPIHSLRITVEIFSRLVRPQADVAALLPRAARYTPGAEAALDALAQQTERIAGYLSPPRRPALQAVAVNAFLEEIAMLLRDASRPLEVDVRSLVQDDVAVLADRPRLSHALLAWMRQCGRSTVRAEQDDQGIWIAAAAAPDDADVRTVLETAGGRLTEARVLFQRP